MFEEPQSYFIQRDTEPINDFLSKLFLQTMNSFKVSDYPSLTEFLYEKTRFLSYLDKCKYDKSQISKKGSRIIQNLIKVKKYLLKKDPKYPFSVSDYIHKFLNSIASEDAKFFKRNIVNILEKNDFFSLQALMEHGHLQFLDDNGFKQISDSLKIKYFTQLLNSFKKIEFETESFCYITKDNIEISSYQVVETLKRLTKVEKSEINNVKPIIYNAFKNKSNKFLILLISAKLYEFFDENDVISLIKDPKIDLIRKLNDAFEKMYCESYSYFLIHKDSFVNLLEFLRKICSIDKKYLNRFVGNMSKLAKGEIQDELVGWLKQGGLKDLEGFAKLILKLIGFY